VAGTAEVAHWAGPDVAAGLLVERHHRRLLAARRADEPVAIHEHRLAVAPGIALLAAEAFLEIDAKHLGAVGRRAGHERAVRRDHVDHVAIDGGRASGALPGFLAVVPGLTRLGLPELSAVGTIEAREVFVAVSGGREPVAERVDPVADDREAGVAAAGALRFPDERWAFGRP